MKRLNPAHIEAVMRLHNAAPYPKLLSMEITDLGEGYARMELHLAEKHENPFASIHGGVYASLLDTACYWAAYCQMEETVGYTTSSLKVDSLSMVRSGRIVVEAQVIKLGKSTGLSEARAFDEEGKILAYATSNLLLLQGKQAMSDALQAAGQPPLPPKYFLSNEHILGGE